MEALRQHPEMVLRPADFVAHRINWGDKAQNIADIARELNLGLQSFVFIDNDAVQRARIREALPEVLVPEWPDEPVTYRSALDSLTCFDSSAITAADVARTAQYATERAREHFRDGVNSVEEWLRGLDMRVRVEELSSVNLSRVTQLMNKTNQMNLSTRRLTSEELTGWLQHGDRRLWAISVADRFGDAGLTGIISVERDGTTARIVDYVLSCRVMGRKVEETMLSIAIADARERHLSRVEAHYRPTAKNKPCLTFLLSSGFAHDNDEKFVWNTEREYPCPPVIALEQAAEQSA